MSNQFKPTTLVGAIAVAMGLSNVAFANTNPASNQDVLQLETLVVTATRSKEKIENVPARINIIEPQILEQSPIAEFPHLLMSDAAINMVQSGGMGQQASIFLRGTNSNHTLVLRDGVRLNNASTGTANLAFIDTTDIQQIEVLKGPASVLYGTDAIGGVVQLISKTPSKTSAFVTGEIGEHKTYKTVLGADLVQDDFYAQIRGQRLESDGTPVTTGSKIKNTAYDQKGYSAKFGVEKERFGASIDYSENAGNNAYLSFGQPRSQDFKNEVINLKGQVNISPDLIVNGRLSQFKDDLEQTTAPDYVKNKTQEAEVTTKWQFTPTQNILAGVAHKKMQGNVLSVSTWSTVRYKENIDSTGYFLQHQYQDNGMSTQVGIRVEDNDKYGTKTVGQGAVRYQILPLTSIYANVGSAFKAPSTNDLYAMAWGANPNLKPEESFSYEIGLDQKLTADLNLGLSLYRNQVKDLISFKSNQLINVDKATFTGGELDLKWQLNDYFLNFSYAYVQAKDEKTKQDLTRRPRQSATLSAGWQVEQYGVSAAVSAKSTAKDFADFPSTTLNTTPGYATVDLNAFWNINPNIKVFTNIQNVGDVHYKTAYDGNNVYYINGGRLASAGVTFKY